MQLNNVLLPLLIALLLQGCASDGDDVADDTALEGDTVKSQMVTRSSPGTGGQQTAPLVGAVLLGTMPGTLAKHLDNTDRMQASRALDTQRNHHPFSWRNAATGIDYTLVSTKIYETAQGPCRDFELSGKIGSAPQKSHGRACQQPNGAWQVQ